MKFLAFAFVFALVLVGIFNLTLPQADPLCPGGNCPTPTGVKHTKTPTEFVNPTDTDTPPDTEIPPTNTKVIEPTNTDIPATETDQPPTSTEFIPTNTNQPTNTPAETLEITPFSFPTDTPGITMPPPPTTETTATSTATRDPQNTPINTLPPTFPPPNHPNSTPDRVLPITGEDNQDGIAISISALLVTLSMGLIVFGLSRRKHE